MGKYVRLGNKTHGANETGAFEDTVEFTLTQPLAWLQAHINVDLTETGGSAAATDVSPLVGLDVEVYVGGNLRARFESVREGDYATGSSRIGEVGLMAFADGAGLPIEAGNGDASVAASGTEVRDVSFRIPIALGGADIGLKVQVKFLWAAVTRWTGGTGTARQDATEYTLAGYLVDELAFAHRFTRITKTGLGASSEYEEPIGDVVDGELESIVLTNIRSSAVEDDIVRVRVESSDQVTIVDALVDQLDQELVSKSGHRYVLSYAATVAVLHRRAAGGWFEGMYYVSVPPTQAKGLKLKVTTDADGSSNEIRALCRYRVPTGRGTIKPTQAPTSASPGGPGGTTVK